MSPSPCTKKTPRSIEHLLLILPPPTSTALSEHVRFFSPPGRSKADATFFLQGDIRAACFLPGLFFNTRRPPSSGSDFQAETRKLDFPLDCNFVTDAPLSPFESRARRCSFIGLKQWSCFFLSVSTLSFFPPYMKKFRIWFFLLGGKVGLSPLSPELSQGQGCPPLFLSSGLLFLFSFFSAIVAAWLRVFFPPTKENERQIFGALLTPLHSSVYMGPFPKHGLTVSPPSPLRQDEVHSSHAMGRRQRAFLDVLWRDRCSFFPCRA